MTHTTILARPIRLAIGTAAVLALMSPAAQARPISQPGGPAGESPGALVQKGAYMPVSPANNVAAAHLGGHDLAPAQPAQIVTAKATGRGFDWFAAAIGAGLALVLVSIGALALTVHGRRHVPLSA